MNKTEIWQQHITSWQESGLSQSAFCTQQNIKLHNFQYWRKRLSAPVTNPNKFTAVTRVQNSSVRLLLGPHVAIELSCDQLPDTCWHCVNEGCCIIHAHEHTTERHASR